jgi:hypothetical protein
VDSTTIVLSLEASEEIAGLSAEDFLLSNPSCQVVELEIDGNSATASITECESGEVSVTLSAFSFGLQEQGPAEDVFALTTFDGDGPSFAFTTVPFTTSESRASVGFEISDQLSLIAENFQVDGCEVWQVVEESLELENCETGEVAVRLAANSLTDSWGNQGPLEDVTFEFLVDQISPTANWREAIITGDGPFVYRSTLQFSEPVVISEGALNIATNVPCASSSTIEERAISVEVECGYAEMTWTFTPGAQDLYGNLMAVEPLVLEIINLEPQVPQEPPTESVTPIIPVPQPEVLPETPVDQLPIGLTPDPVILPEPPSGDAESRPIAPEVAPVNSESEELQTRPEPVTDFEAPAVISELDTESRAQTSADSESDNPVSPDSFEQQSQVTAPQAPVLATPVVAQLSVGGESKFPWAILPLAMLIGVSGFALFRLSGK